MAKIIQIGDKRLEKKSSPVLPDNIQSSSPPTMPYALCSMPYCFGPALLISAPSAWFEVCNFKLLLCPVLMISHASNSCTEERERCSDEITSHLYHYHQENDESNKGWFIN